MLLADQSVEEKEINLIYDKIFQNGRVHVDIPEAKDISPVQYMTYSPSPSGNCAELAFTRPTLICRFLLAPSQNKSMLFLQIFLHISSIAIFP